MADEAIQTHLPGAERDPQATLLGELFHRRVVGLQRDERPRREHGECPLSRLCYGPVGMFEDRVPWKQQCGSTPQGADRGFGYSGEGASESGVR
jgi:hypothetical protein